MVNKISRSWEVIRIIFYSVLYSAFILIPLEVVLQGSLCFTYTHLHVVCPACGITRAFSCLMHGEWSLAYQYHPLFTLCIAPICTFLFAQDTYTIITRITRKAIEPIASRILISRARTMNTFMTLITFVLFWLSFGTLYLAYREKKHMKGAFIVIIILNVIFFMIWGFMRNINLPFWAQ